MADDRDRGEDADEELSHAERDEIEERMAGSSRVIHEVIRAEAEEELDRPAASLIFSGLVAGVAMTASILAKSYLRAGLPNAPWRNLIESFGYTLGFVIVIMARLQLFTESTVSAVLPLATHPSVSGLAKLLRLWAIVFLSNMVGTFLVALALVGEGLVAGPDHAALMEISGELLTHDAWQILLLGIPSGFLVGTIAWILPNNREAQIWVVIFLTYLIGLGHFSHVVAGSTEAWLLWLAGRTSFGHAVGGVILPSLLGNIVGGTGLFALLAHGQVRAELDREGGR